MGFAASDGVSHTPSLADARRRFGRAGVRAAAQPPAGGTEGRVAQRAAAAPLALRTGLDVLQPAAAQGDAGGRGIVSDAEEAVALAVTAVAGIASEERRAPPRAALAVRFTLRSVTLHGNLLPR